MILEALSDKTYYVSSTQSISMPRLTLITVGSPNVNHPGRSRGGVNSMSRLLFQRAGIPGVNPLRGRLGECACWAKCVLAGTSASFPQVAEDRAVRGINWRFAIDENALVPALAQWERKQDERAQEQATTGVASTGGLGNLTSEDCMWFRSSMTRIGPKGPNLL